MTAWSLGVPSGGSSYHWFAKVGPYLADSPPWSGPLTLPPEIIELDVYIIQEQADPDFNSGSAGVAPGNEGWAAVYYDYSGGSFNGIFGINPGDPPATDLQVWVVAYGPDYAPVTGTPPSDPEDWVPSNYIAGGLQPERGSGGPAAGMGFFVADAAFFEVTMGSPPPLMIGLIADSAFFGVTTFTATTPMGGSDIGGIELTFRGSLDPTPIDIDWLPGSPAYKRAIATVTVTTPRPAIINGRPWLPTFWAESDSSIEAPQGLSHIRVKGLPDLDVEGDWSEPGKPDYWWTVDDLTLPDQDPGDPGYNLAAWPEHFGGPSWISKNVYRPNVRRKALYGAKGQKVILTKAVHFTSARVEHMWLDLGAGNGLEQPYTILVVGMVNSYPNRTYGHYLIDAGKEPPVLDVDTDHSIDDGLDYRNVMLFQLNSALICTRMVVEQGVYARVVHNYIPRLRVFEGTYDGSHSFAGYYDPKDKQRARGRTDDKTVRHLLLGRRANNISDNLASNMTILEVRIWRDALTEKQVRKQYKQIAGHWKFNRLTKED